MAIEHLEAEQAVLGSILIDPDIVPEVLRTVNAVDFLDPTSQRIYGAVQSLYRQGKPVDAFTVRDKVGPELSKYMSQLMEITPTSANWAEYAAIMHQQATLQRLKEQAQTILNAINLEECRPAAANVEQLLSEGKQLDTWTTQQMMDDFFKAQDPYAETPEYIGIGFDAIDSGIFIRPGNFVILGGYPSDGKTALSLMWAYHMAQKYKVGFFSLETDKEDLRDRMVSFTSQVRYDAIQKQTLSEDDWKSVIRNVNPFTSRNLTVLDTPGITVTELSSITKSYGFDIVFIDYVQLMTSEFASRQNRTEQMADVSRELHTFARKSGVTVIALAQLSRPEKAAGWRAPTMHDLKESGQFEQDADVIFLVFKPDPKNSELSQDNHRYLKIVKNKRGRRCSTLMYFDGERQTFRVVERKAEENTSKADKKKEFDREAYELSRIKKAVREKNGTDE